MALKVTDNHYDRLS